MFCTRALASPLLYFICFHFFLFLLFDYYYFNYPPVLLLSFQLTFYFTLIFSVHLSFEIPKHTQIYTNRQIHMQLHVQTNISKQLYTYHLYTGVTELLEVCFPTTQFQVPSHCMLPKTCIFQCNHRLTQALSPDLIDGN